MAQHVWFTISSHVTAEGWVSYQRCPCGRWRTVRADEVLAAPAGRCGRLTPAG